MSISKYIYSSNEISNNVLSLGRVDNDNMSCDMNWCAYGLITNFDIPTPTPAERGKLKIIVTI